MTNDRKIEVLQRRITKLEWVLELFMDNWATDTKRPHLRRQCWVRDRIQDTLDAGLGMERKFVPEGAYKAALMDGWEPIINWDCTPVVDPHGARLVTRPYELGFAETTPPRRGAD